MKKYFLLLSLVFIGFASCKKSAPAFNAAQQAATDDAAIQAYIAANKITATKDPSGLYYSIITPGTGAYPTVASTVDVNYTGSLLNGSVFAPTSNITNPLNSFIQGWQVGIPHINAGGTILLLIPSALGYGNSSPGGGIPVNSVLIFKINLLAFSN
jgi:FKBP-type peptidyl-prolyl cis-trans isomerase FkpA